LVRSRRTFAVVLGLDGQGETSGSGDEEMETLPRTAYLWILMSNFRLIEVSEIATKPISNTPPCLVITREPKP